MLHDFAAIARQVIEFISVMIIISGVIQASFRVLMLAVNCYRKKCPVETDIMIKLRLSFESTLMLGLQFLMAADIIGTITKPDLQGVVILTVIVLLRVVLSFTLSREVAEMDRQKRENDMSEFKKDPVLIDTGFKSVNESAVDCQVGKG